MLKKEQVQTMLEDVYDPEIGVDIVTLGLIYDIKINEDNDIHVLMTFTFPGCPYGPELIAEVEEKLKEIKEARNIKVEVTFEPAWSPDKMDQDIRSALGF